MTNHQWRRFFGHSEFVPITTTLKDIRRRSERIESRAIAYSI